MEEKIERVFDIYFRVLTTKGEEKVICLTEFFEPQNVNIYHDNDKVVLTIEKKKS